MTTEKMVNARRLARDFIRAVSEVLQEREREDNNIIGTKATGALRRKSMDLTRALAEMRKP